MHIRRAISRALSLGAALAVAGGTIVVGTATPSFAAATATLSQTKGPAAGTNTINVSGTTFAAGAAVQFQSAASCSTNPGTVAAGTVVNATTVTLQSPATSINVVVPALTAGVGYNVCAYTANTVTGTQTAVTTTNPYTPHAALTSLSVTPTSGPPTGSVVAVSDTNTAFGTGTTVEFNTASCPATYAATAGSTTVFAGTVATFTPGATSLNVTAPTALSRTATYYVCTYTGSATTSALISGTSAAVYAVQGMVPVPASGPAAGTNTIVLTDANATFGASTAVEFNTTGCPTTYATPSATVVSGAVTAFTTTTLNVTAPALTAGTYYICAYNGTAANSALASRTTTAGYTVLGSAGTLTLSATRGSSDGGTTLTATDSTSAAFGPGTVLEFNNASTCPATYATPGAGVVAATTTTVTATAVTITQPPMPVDSYTVCAYTGTGATSALISASAGNSYTVYGVLSLNTYNGPSAGGNSITATTSGGTFLAGTTVVFHADASLACPATYGTPAANMVATGLRVLTTNKLAFVVPAGVTTLLAGYRACAYAGGTAGSTLVSETPASAPYVVAAPATILSVSPAAGAAQGGTAITVTGTNLIGITGATVGGVPLLNVQSINGGTGFTATTPAHAAGGPFTVAVTTAGGTASKANAFTFSNGIVVSPAKAANTRPVDVDVQGVGFGAITFSATDTNGATPNAVTGHVYLVNGRYDPSASTTPAGAFKTNDALLECTDVLVISDSELVCTLYLAGDNTQRATLFRASNAALADASITQGTDLLTSPTDAAFTPADVGLTVSGTGIPAGTTIVSVISATQARLSSRATADVAVGALTLAPPRTTLATNTIDLTAPTTVSNAAAVFQQTDVGRRIVAPGIPAGTTITGVAVDNKSITLSAPATVAAVANLAVRIGDPPVPNGAYTITVVSSGAVGATGPTYIQSVISSGSTFTVADY